MCFECFHSHISWSLQCVPTRLTPNAKIGVVGAAQLIGARVRLPGIEVSMFGHSNPTGNVRARPTSSTTPVRSNFLSEFCNSSKKELLAKKTNLQRYSIIILSSSFQSSLFWLFLSLGILAMGSILPASSEHHDRHYCRCDGSFWVEPGLGGGSSGPWVPYTHCQLQHRRRAGSPLCTHHEICDGRAKELAQRRGTRPTVPSLWMCRAGQSTLYW